MNMPSEYNQFLKDFLDDLDAFLYKNKRNRFEDDELILLYKKYDLLVKNIPEEKETRRFNIQNSFISIIPTIVACILAVWFFINQSKFKNKNVVGDTSHYTSASNNVGTSIDTGIPTNSDSFQTNTDSIKIKKMELQLQSMRREIHDKDLIIEKGSELNELLTELAYDLNAYANNTKFKYSWWPEINEFAKLNKSNVIKRDFDTLTDNDIYRVNRNFKKMMVLAKQIQK